MMHNPKITCTHTHTHTHIYIYISIYIYVCVGNVVVMLYYYFVLCSSPVIGISIHGYVNNNHSNSVDDLQ